MKKRFISMLLVLAMLSSLLPQTVFAAEEGDSPEGLTIVIDDVRVVEGGQVAGSLPAGVSFSRNTLTLDNASLGMLRVHGGDVTIALEGRSTIRNDGSFVDEEGEVLTPVMTGTEGENIAVTITGPGSLEVDSSGTDAIRTFVADYTDLTITDGAEVAVRTDYEGHGIMEVVSGDLTMNGGASLTVDGPNGIWIVIEEHNRGAHAYHFADCTVTASRLVVGAQVDGVTNQVTVGEGAEINLSPIPVRDIEINGRALTLRQGSSLLLDGGEINVDTSATPEGPTPSVMVEDDGFHFELRSGALNIDSVGNHGMMIMDEGAFLQTGGTLNIRSHGENAGAALKVYEASATFRGGTASLTGLSGVTLNPSGAPDDPLLNNGESTFTVSGGTLDIRGEGGHGVSLRTGATLNVLDGTMSVSSRKAAGVTAPGIAPPITSDEGAQINFLGGTVNLDNESEDLALMAGGYDSVVFGEGVTVVDNNTGEPLEMVQTFNQQLQSSSVTISGERSFGTYGCALAITSGAVTQGARFNARAVVTLGAETGQVAFPFPEDMVYVPGSLTVDGQRAEPVSTAPLTVSLEEGGTIRFSAVADNTGAHTLVANTTAEGEKHQATLPFTVGSFNLSLPSRTPRLEIPVAGSASPGSTVTFYEGEEVLGEAKTTVLGTWSGTVTLPDVEGEHTVYAVVTPEDGESFRSDDHKITYAPETDEVKTLTITNYVHGRTSADPPVEERVVVDYVNRTTSSNYYTFWPDLPTFEYRVDFVKDASAQQCVTVISYDRNGEETRTPLRYRAADDAWYGAQDFDEWHIPARFQVEFIPGSTWGPEQSPGIDVGTTPGETPPEPEPIEDVENDDSEGAFAMGDANFSFLVSDAASLTLTDAAGEAVPFTTTGAAGGTAVHAGYTGDGLYVAELSAGNFPQYPGFDTLYILIEGASPPEPGHYKYAEGVQVVSALPARPAINTVYVIESAGEAWYIEADGSAVEAGLEEVYEELLFTQADLTVDAEIDTRAMEEELVSQFLESSTFASVREAVDRLEQEHAAEAGAVTEASVKAVVAEDASGMEEGFKANLDGFEVEANVKVNTAKDVSTGDAVIEVAVSMRMAKKITIRGREGTVSLSLENKVTLEPNYRVEVNEQKLSTLYQTTKQTDEFEMQVAVTVTPNKADEEEKVPELGIELTEYFEEAENKRVLERVTLGKESDKVIPLGEIPLVCPIPGVGLVIRPTIEYDFSAEGEASVTYHSSTTTTKGYIYRNGNVEPFKETGDTGRDITGALHVTAKAYIGVDVFLGITILQIVDVGAFAKFGVAGITEGHGQISTSKDENANRIELYAAVSLVLEMGFRAKLKLGRTFSFNAEKLFYQKQRLVWQVGTRETPYEFSVVEEEPIYVSESSDLTTRIDMNLNYMCFDAQNPLSEVEPFVPLKKVFEEDSPAKYVFSIVGDAHGMTLTEDGLLTVPPGLSEEFEFQVKLQYFGRGENYELYKIVPMRYTPTSLTIYKEISGAPPVASFLVKEQESGNVVGTWTTNGSGVVTMPVAPGCQYVVTEIACAAGYRPLIETQVVEAGGEVTFVNVPVVNFVELPIYTPEIELNGSLDPSGFVYEGIESNRLSGVTTTLYFSDSKTKPAGNALESQKWDAAAFQQQNPLTTDTAGQYMWLVPDGWWQVKYEKAGYATAYSDWLPVPPVQTEVNQALVSTAAAKLALSADVGDNTVILRFDRPVRLSTVTAQTVTITGSGALTGELSPVDAGAAADGQACATTFYFRLSDGQTLKDGDTLSASYNGVVTYAGTASSGSASAAVIDLMPFSDVSAGAYFYDSVLWAVNHSPQITTGTNTEGTLFSPDNACTRGQVVTFLWRAMGEPEPESTTTPFTDVKQGSYYYKAVLWAVENGITNGTNAEGTLFSPDATCTRGQIVTFLHRTEKTPEPTANENPFQDVDASAYYYDAVLWAVEWGITNGTNTEGTLFSPDATCTRGQIVTFLCRDMK